MSVSQLRINHTISAEQLCALQIATKLSTMLDAPVSFADDCIGAVVRYCADSATFRLECRASTLLAFTARDSHMPGTGGGDSQCNGLGRGVPAGELAFLQAGGEERS